MKTNNNLDDCTHVASKGEFKAEQFNLSEERYSFLKTTNGKEKIDEDLTLFKLRDVKKFVKLLKSEANRLLSEGDAIVMNDIINFRAGEKLV